MEKQVGNQNITESKLTFGSYTTKLLKAFQKYTNGRSRLSHENICDALHELYIYPSQSQIKTMIQFAKKYGSPREEEFITFGEFCTFVYELQNCGEMKKTSDTPESSTGKTKSASKRRIKTSVPGCQVFLGGSCGDSTWRRDYAIPFLIEENISFYNPQVKEWKPELIEVEEKAKREADLLFFVIDNKTRGVASLCEIAYLVGCSRQIIILFEDLLSVVDRVSSEKTSVNEQEDIVKGRKHLIHIVERNGIPIFCYMYIALQCTSKYFKKGVKVQDLTKDNVRNPVTHGHVLVGEYLRKLRESFDKYKATDGKIYDVLTAYKDYAKGEGMCLKWLKKVPNMPYLFFEEYCCLITEYRKTGPNEASKRGLGIASPATKANSGLKGSTSTDTSYVYDIFLGGSCGEANWRENLAIPLLKREVLSYMNPSAQDLGDDHLSAEREKCRFLLFVIADGTRALSAMIEAAFYIGKGCKVTLCLEKLSKPLKVSGETLTESAFKDYSRGREYLRDMANRKGVSIFENVSDSLQFIVQSIRNPSKQIGSK